MRSGVVLRGYDPLVQSLKGAIDTGDETIVQQHFAEEVDINTIVRRFGMTAAMPAGVPGGIFGDFTGVTDYESAVAAIDRAKSGFMALPPDVRERFGNNPGNLIEYAQGVSLEDLEVDLRGEVPVVPPVVPPVAPGE